VKAQADGQGVALHEHCKVAEVGAGRLRTDDSTWHNFEDALWCTQAAAAGWLKDTGLPVGTSDGSARVFVIVVASCLNLASKSLHTEVT
jgi:hypothetical protein